MKTAIIGYGKMGREIESVLKERGHEVVAVIDTDPLAWSNLPLAEVALEFTGPDSAEQNIRRCLDAGVAVVSGSTGWTAALDKTQAYCRERGGAMLWASNFSIGVNLMFEVNAFLTAKMARLGGMYTPSIEETHHIHKKDAPSGTAKTLAEQIGAPRIVSKREGEVVGVHTVRWESAEDVLEIRHELKNRRALASGAVRAAEFLQGRHGVFTMKDVL